MLSQVATAAKEALRRVGGVVGNPEIQSHVPVLINAVSNPGTFSVSLRLVVSDYLCSLGSSIHENRLGQPVGYSFYSHHRCAILGPYHASSYSGTP